MPKFMAVLNYIHAERGDVTEAIFDDDHRRLYDRIFEIVGDRCVSDYDYDVYQYHHGYYHITDNEKE